MLHCRTLTYNQSFIQIVHRRRCVDMSNSSGGVNYNIYNNAASHYYNFYSPTLRIKLRIVYSQCFLFCAAAAAASRLPNTCEAIWERYGTYSLTGLPTRRTNCSVAGCVVPWINDDSRNGCSGVMVDPPGPQFEDFSVIFVSWGCKWRHLRNRLFCDLVPEVLSLCGRARMGV